MTDTSGTLLVDDFGAELSTNASTTPDASRARAMNSNCENEA
jgi:hypothetical protein